MKKNIYISTFVCRNIVKIQFIFSAILMIFVVGCGTKVTTNKTKTTPSAEKISLTDTKSKETKTQKDMEKATFGAGCFWGVEYAFQQVKGVESVTSGYSGGHKDNPTYKEVCYDKTGHAEVVEIAYDPEVVSYDELLIVFWECHDPTTLNRQGPDRGTQYRSAIYYHNEEQKQAAIASKEKEGNLGIYPGPVVTEITEASKFYSAEDYHQDYFQKRGGGVCHINPYRMKLKKQKSE